jgi:prolyl oligopeptidase
LRVSADHPERTGWKEIIPQGEGVLESMGVAGGKLIANYEHNASSELKVFDLAGHVLAIPPLPTIGSVDSVGGNRRSSEAFFGFNSYTVPPTIYRIDLGTHQVTMWDQVKAAVDASRYEVKQVWYTSKDGTRVPMFITGKKGLKRDGNVPTLMWAYGGFLVNMTPEWNPEFAWWIEQGGYYAEPDLRGGGEYGESWHKAGMFEKKQNVFDDFFAAAQYLFDNKYTQPKRLAIRGRSNGGLLMGAAMTQHPEMFGAIWCGYPLLDMTRFQKFLIGRWWTTEYGDPDSAEQFKYLLKYSPYQNVKTGEKYPAIMFFTGDSDTRVDPLHARKMAAEMQAATGSDRPILLHYEKQAGHSSGVSVRQAVEDTADELAFLWNEAGP